MALLVVHLEEIEGRITKVIASIEMHQNSRISIRHNEEDATMLWVTGNALHMQYLCIPRVQWIYCLGIAFNLLTMLRLIIALE